MKKHIALLAATTAVTSFSAHAVLVAGWDTWTTAGASTTPVTYAPTFTQLVTATAVGTPVSNDDPTFPATIGHFNNVGVMFGASGDGTWGSIADSVSPPTSDALDQFAAAGLVEETNGTFEFTITASGSPILLTTFNFDALGRFGGNPQDWTLTASGDITPGLIASGTIADDNGNANFLTNTAGNDFDVLLSTLADRTLEDGESASFLLNITGGGDDSSGGNFTLIDNVGIFGDAIPEPSSSLLALLGGIFLIRRRR